MQKIAIITAMKEEAEHVIEKYDLKRMKSLHTLEIYESEEYVLALSGIGKVQAGIAASYVFLHYNISHCINIGIAGNLRWDRYKVGDVFFATKLIQHDIYLPFWGSHLDYAKKAILLSKQDFPQAQELSFGVYPNWVCLTWDQFIDDSATLQDLESRYEGDIVEMEAFAIATTAREYGLLERLICIKAISDGADSEAKDAHMDNLDFAMKNSIKVLEKVLHKLTNK